MFKLRIYKSDFIKLCKGCTNAEIQEFIKKFNVEVLEGQKMKYIVSYNIEGDEEDKTIIFHTLDQAWECFKELNNMDYCDLEIFNLMLKKEWQED